MKKGAQKPTDQVTIGKRSTSKARPGDNAAKTRKVAEASSNNTGVRAGTSKQVIKKNNNGDTTATQAPRSKARKPRSTIDPNTPIRRYVYCMPDSIRSRKLSVVLVSAVLKFRLPQRGSPVKTECSGKI